MEKHLLLKRTIEEKCIIRHSEQRIISSSDKSQSWLIDLKSILMSPAPLGAIASLFWDRFEDRLPFQVGGMEFSAVPIITAIVLEGQNRGYNVNGFIIRKKRKETGLGKSIEGTINSYPIVLIDDIVNSGKSLIKASAVLNGNTVQISSAFCVIDYESDGARTWSSEVGIPIERLFVLSEFGLSLMQSDPPSASIDYSVLWRTGDTSGNPFHVTPKSAPIVWNNRVYMGTESGDFLCRQTENGEELWCYRTKTSNQKGIWSTASIHEGRVFFGGYDGTLYCLDALTGKDIWKTIACEYIGSSPCIAGLLGLVLIGLENDIHGRRGANAAFDTITGNLVWADPLQELQHGSAVFCPQTGRAIFGTCDGFLVSYNAKQGIVCGRENATAQSKAPRPFLPMEKSLPRDLLMEAFILWTRKAVWKSSGWKQMDRFTRHPCFTMADYISVPATDISTRLISL